VSRIASIIDAVAAWGPTYDSDVSISVRQSDTLVDTLHPDDCPLRMLLVVDDDAESEFEFIAMGGTIKASWRLIDRLYIRPAEEGEGIAAWADKVEAYVSSYAGVVRSNRNPVAMVTIPSFTYSSGVREWGGIQWATITMALQIEDYKNAT
jgi:hypothetical protein